MKVDMVIENGKIFVDGKIVKAAIGINEGKIVAIKKDLNQFVPNQTVNAGGNLVIPGPIDAHVHAHIFGLLHRDDFKTVTEAAAAGGTTTIVDFVNPTNRTLRKAFLKKKAAGEKKCLIDFGLHAYVCSERNLAEIGELTKLGVFSFKHFMASPDGVPAVNDDLLLRSFEVIKKYRAMASVHAEDEDLCSKLKQKFIEIGRRDPLSHCLSRPPITETRAISKAIAFAIKVGVPLHVFHVSTGKGSALIGEAKRKGRPITAETCPHYLIFTRNDLKKLGPFLQVTPPLRSSKDKAKLWQALTNGTIDFVTSDHYAPLFDEKKKGWENIWEVEAGIPGVETRVPLIFGEGFHKRGVPIKRIIEMLSTSPAKVFGIYPKKGTIRSGSDADLVIIDLKRKLKIEATKLHQQANWTPFEGMEVRGIPIRTIVRGEMIAVEGEVIGKPGYGRFIKKSDINITI